MRRLLLAIGCLLAASRAVAQRLPAGTYTVIGAGTDTSADRPATVLTLPATMWNGETLVSGNLVLSGDGGRSFVLTLNMTLGANSETLTSRGTLNGADRGNFRALVASGHSAPLGFLQQKPDGTVYLTLGVNRRLKLHRPS